ncbi:MATE family efflux transporter [Bacterioplanoides pacificum]|uniref:Multidrug-efflux transporter n=1 Tax=Bacterioplanoides pacificum TaxID=1171596 RepID=A0ABV7VR35_9GAMM
MLRLIASLLAIEPRRLQHILIIGVPIIGGMLSQSLINLVDAAMVGRLGDAALAGVGVGSYASFIVVSTVMGLSSGVQALVARRHGANHSHSHIAEPVLAGLTLACLVGIPLTVLFYLLAPPLLPLFNDAPEVSDIAIPYFQWRTLAAVFIGMNFVFRGFWSGIGATKQHLKVLLLMHLSNVAISYVLIFGLPQLGFYGFGATGSGMGTAASMLLGTLAYGWLTFRRHRARFADCQRPTKASLLSVAQLALPNSTQQVLFALGTSVMFWIIGQIGTQEQAVGHILINLSLLLILPAVGLGIASTSLVGQALGRQDSDDAYRWGWEVVRVAVFIMALVGIPLWLMPQEILRLFTPEQHLIELGTWPLRISGIAIAMEVTAMVLTQALLGAGASRQVMRINLIMQWGVLLPLAYYVGPFAGAGLTGVWILQGVQRISLSLVYAVIWRTRHWASIHI